MLPSSGLPDYIIGNAIDNRPATMGTNTMRLSVYSPLEFKKITYQGRSVSFVGSTQFGRNVATSWIDVPAGQERSTVFTLKGKVALTDGKYRLDVTYQLMVNPTQSC